MEILWLIAIGVIAYLIGSVSSAIIVGRIFGGEDIRTKGSGNAGATNALRTYGGFQICVSRKYFRFSSVSYFVFNFRRRRYCVYTILCDFGCACCFYAQGKYKALDKRY